MPIKGVLRPLAKLTGWQIFIEPGLTNVVYAKFKKRRPHEVLPFIFPSDLNYALVTSTDQADSSTNRTTVSAKVRLLVFCKDRSKATEVIAEPEIDLASPIPNELIVILKKGSKLTPQEIADRIGAQVVAVSKDGASIRFRFADGDALERGKEILSEMLKKEDISDILNNYYMISPENAKAYAANGGLSLPQKITALPGDSTTIAMVDSGLHLNGISYEDLLLEAVNFTGKEFPLTDEPTHLDSMLGSSVYLMQQSGYDAVNINFLPLIVTDESGTGDMFSVAQAILYAAEAGIKVINVPLAGSVSSPILADATQYAISKGAVIYAATGNEPTGQVTYPAGYAGVNGVTALESGHIAPYANNGDFADVAIAGTGVFCLDNNFYMTTGTSVSTTYASTLTALQIENANKTAAQAQEYILQKFDNK